MSLRTLYDEASLWMTPSGYEDGKLFSELPTDGSGDFTFSRGSNLAATRVDVNGLIEKGRENLLLQSNQFDTTWTNGSSSETSGYTGYDGSNNAWKVTKIGAAGYIRQVLSSSGVQTFSVYVKAADSDYVALYIASGTSASVWFNLTNGTTDSLNNAITSNIESVGNGWYRCSLTANLSLTDVRIYPAEAASGVSATSGSLYIQDAQLEAGLVATDYIETGASTAQAGILEDMPRFDYSGGETCPSLLLEPSRTNLIPNSEYLIDGVTNITPTYNYGVSPDGFANSTFALPSANVAAHRFNYTDLFTYSSSTSYCASAFIKSGGHRYVAINIVLRNSGSFQETASGLIDLQENTIVINGSNTLWTGIDVFKEEYANGFYRYAITAKTPASGSDRVDVQFNITDETGNSFAGNGTDGVIFYGLQAEQGSYPTSYIPNHSGGSVTRGDDSCSVTGVSSLIGQTEGTLFAEVDWNVKPESGSPVIGILTLNNDANNLQNCILLGIERQSGGTNRVYCFVINSNVTQAELFGSAITDGTYKIAFAYKANDFALYVNGSQIGTDTSGSVPALSEVLLGKRYGTDLFNTSDGIKQALLFKERLSNAELAKLTTL